MSTTPGPFFESGVHAEFTPSQARRILDSKANQPLMDLVPTLFDNLHLYNTVLRLDRDPSGFALHDPEAKIALNRSQVTRAIIKDLDDKTDEQTLVYHLTYTKYKNNLIMPNDLFSDGVRRTQDFFPHIPASIETNTNRQIGFINIGDLLEAFAGSTLERVDALLPRIGKSNPMFSFNTGANQTYVAVPNTTARYWEK
jgi:hypothetical protein